MYFIHVDYMSHESSIRVVLCGVHSSVFQVSSGFDGYFYSRYTVFRCAPSRAVSYVPQVNNVVILMVCMDD